MGFVLKGEVIHSYDEQTKNGKTYTVYQVQFRAGKAMSTVSVKDFQGLRLPNGPAEIGVFPDLWQGQRGPMLNWVTSKEQAEAKRPLEAVGGKKPL